MGNPARTLGGTYVNDGNKLVLNKDGYCKIDKDIVGRDKVTDCEWEYNDYTKEITISYEYESGYYYTHTYTDWSSYTLKIKDKNTLVEVYGDDQFKKEK